jgi:hypothetical protein
MTGRVTAGAGPLLVAVVAGCVLATACSSGSHASDSTTFAADYLSASHAYRSKLAQLQSQASAAQQQGSAAEVAVFRGMLDVTKSTVSQMQRLHASAQFSHTFDQFLAALRDQQSSLQNVLTAVDRQDNTAIDTAVVALSRALQNGLRLQTDLDNAVSAKSPTTT